MGYDPLAYYHEHYDGLTRSELRKINSGLYSYLSNHNLLEQIPTNASQWIKDPLGYYHEHYEGLTRAELNRENHAFYAYLWRHGLLHKIPK